MTEAIRKSGVPVWFLVAEDEGHGFSKKKNRDYQFAAMVQFVRQYLLD
jgi:dipeptidyl aminopeptidase/acylaminoacyl peptidase